MLGGLGLAIVSCLICVVALRYLGCCNMGVWCVLLVACCFEVVSSRIVWVFKIVVG